MAFSVSSSYAKLRSIVEATPNDPLPSLASIQKATKSLVASLPSTGLGEAATEAHLLSDLPGGFNGTKTSSNYYGFVTGGMFPIAEVADNIVTAFDQSPMVHLPDQSISTVVEDRALGMLVQLLNLGPAWEGRTFTTGATGANILGLACGREFVVNSRLNNAIGGCGVGEIGILAACMKAGIKEIQVLTTMGHSSLYKAASVNGLGRHSVKDIPVSKNEPWKIDVDSLERELRRSEEGVVSIVAISAGEVNSGKFAVSGLDEMKKIRGFCDKYGAWLHVDGAFGIFARSLPNTAEFASLISLTSGLELADSVTGDCHKLLNVPYDCGFFLTRSADTLYSIFQNPNAAYLSSGPEASIPSPLNIGLENSRRFRALPVYAVLLAHGREGLGKVFAKQVRLARGVSEFLKASNDYELLPSNSLKDDHFEDIHIIVIFRAKDERKNSELVNDINATRKMYVSGTQWEGKPACRIAVSTWKVEVERDLKLVTDVLKEVVGDSPS
ncbi:pyridoxal phosphate-dependent transferase [Hyaloscypha sp. PMI_1271]|nr:pyridoxal phosphate-dependent transferase [Hyaloscypha sp. PMI_1271]